MHYQRWRTHGTFDKSPPKVRDLCDCGEPVRARGMCRKCGRADHYRRNKERARVISRQYYADNRDALLEASRRWRADHPGYSAAQYQAADKDARRERTRELAKDPVRQARHREMEKAWRLKNYDAWTIRNRANARRRRKIDGVRVDYVAILAKWGMVCHICTLAIASLDDLHMDHVIPLSKGGPHSEDNIRPSHALCNLRKGAKIA